MHSTEKLSSRPHVGEAWQSLLHKAFRDRKSHTKGTLLKPQQMQVNAHYSSPQDHMGTSEMLMSRPTSGHAAAGLRNLPRPTWFSDGAKAEESMEPYISG